MSWRVAKWQDDGDDLEMIVSYRVCITVKTILR